MWHLLREIFDLAIESLYKVRRLKKHNKILWLDHGKQISFTDQTELVCDAYEEFLITKKVPQNHQEIEELASDHIAREKAEHESAQKSEEERLVYLIDHGDTKEAMKEVKAYLLEQQAKTNSQ